MPDREFMIAAIETHCRAESEKDKEAWMGLYADEAVFEDPVGMWTVRGKEALNAEFWPRIENAEYLRLRPIEDVIVCGNEAIGILAAEMKMDGVARELRPIVVNFVFREDGKITNVRSFFKYD